MIVFSSYLANYWYDTEYVFAVFDLSLRVIVCIQLLSTAEEVSKLQEELERMQPQLEEAVQESIVTMQQISEDTVS